MSKTNTLLTLTVIVSACLSVLRAGEDAKEAPKTHKDLPAARVPHLKEGPIMDGKLDDPFWKKAVKLSRFQALIGGFEKVAPQTEVWVASASDTLFMAIRCHETDMANLKAKKRGRDVGVWDDDCLEIFIRSSSDPDEPIHHYALNAAGAIDDWYNRRFVWDSAIKVSPGKEEKAWVLEIAFPFSDLHLTKDKSSLAGPWRLNIFRTRPMHKGDKKTRGVAKIGADGKPFHEETAWSPVEHLSYHVPHRAGYLFMDAFSKGK